MPILLALKLNVHVIKLKVVQNPNSGKCNLNENVVSLSCFSR